MKLSCVFNHDSHQVLDDEVRACLCPDKIGAERWIEVRESRRAE